MMIEFLACAAICGLCFTAVLMQTGDLGLALMLSGLLAFMCGLITALENR